jgi:prepilin-type N-terminal cleavage/methylation domain-containing protein
MIRNRQSGFTLVELLVVMAIMALLLAMGAGLFSSAGRGQSRQAARSLVTGVLTNAQNRALTAGEPRAVVMMPYETGREGQLGRAFTIFEVRQDEATDTFVAERQLRRWIELPGRFIFSKAGAVTGEGQNGFAQPPIVEVSVPAPKSEGTRKVAMPAIIFGDSGRVIWPAGSGELELQLSEGVVQDGVAVATGDQERDARQREIFIIGRQTGRARLVKTE